MFKSIVKKISRRDSVNGTKKGVKHHRQLENLIKNGWKIQWIMIVDEGQTISIRLVKGDDKRVKRWLRPNC